jgi:hypothetical protein
VVVLGTVIVTAACGSHTATAPTPALVVRIDRTRDRRLGHAHPWRRWVTNPSIQLATGQPLVNHPCTGTGFLDKWTA